MLRPLLVRCMRGLLALPRPAAATIAAGWFALIWIASSRPGSILVRPWYWGVASNLAHAPLFGLLALWLVLLTPRRAGWPALTRAQVSSVLAAVLTLGIVDELHQSFTPHRSMSASDLLTDVAGAATVLSLLQALAPSAIERTSFALRFVLGALACIAAASVATFSSRVLPSLTWL